MSVDLDVRRDGELLASEQDDVVRAYAAAVPAQRPTDEAELLADLELAGADLSAEVLTVVVRPQQADEFRCACCFLVLHRARLAAADVCRDCA
jgi:hypothetical protein